MPCNDNVFSDIKATCVEDRAGGVEAKAYLMSRDDLSFTLDATVKTKVTALDIAATKKAFSVLGVKIGLNCKTEIVVRPDGMNKYKHTFICKSKQIASADIETIDKLDNLVIVVERKTKSADGTFLVLGLQGGLYKSVHTRDENVNDGDIMLEFASVDTALEPHSEYVYVNGAYAVAKAALEALLATQV